jgi:hypothetical protein
MLLVPSPRCFSLLLLSIFFTVATFGCAKPKNPEDDQKLPEPKTPISQSPIPAGIENRADPKASAPHWRLEYEPKMASFKAATGYEIVCDWVCDPPFDFVGDYKPVMDQLLSLQDDPSIRGKAFRQITLRKPTSSEPNDFSVSSINSFGFESVAVKHHEKVSDMRAFLARQEEFTEEVKASYMALDEVRNIQAQAKREGYYFQVMNSDYKGGLPVMKRIASVIKNYDVKTLGFNTINIDDEARELMRCEIFGARGDNIVITPDSSLETIKEQIERQPAYESSAYYAAPDCLMPQL